MINLIKRYIYLVRSLVKQINTANYKLRKATNDLDRIAQDHAKSLYKLESRTHRLLDSVSSLQRELYGIKLDAQHQKMVRDDIQHLITAFETWQNNAAINHDDIAVISAFLTENVAPLVREKKLGR